MMAANGDPAALGQLLRSRRERLVPADVGLPAGSSAGLSAARHPDDPDISTLIAEFQRDSEHVRDWWPRHDVTAIGGSGSKKLRHPRLGPVEYSHAVLQVADQLDQTLVTYALITGS